MDFRIKKLDIFILRQFGLLFVAAFFICLFVLMMQFLWQYVNDLIGKGLTLDIMAQFFWYMALMMVPQALPLAILLSSLLTYGNLGESSELTAIKASGVSLIQSFRSLIVLVAVICLASFYFQNHVGPKANMKIAQLFLSIKQKSPELEIPEGIFYDGIPGCNIYVQKKDMRTGHLYGIMIYRMTDSFEDAAIILADSGMIQSTAEKKHLLLSLWSGEWFENMKESQMGGSAAVPYRRETFIDKRIVLDYDGDFSMMDMASLSNNARGKSLKQLTHDIDSLNGLYDSIGRSFYADARRMYYPMPSLSRKDSARVWRAAKARRVDLDKAFGKLSAEKKRTVVSAAANTVQSELNDLQFKGMMTANNERVLRLHEMEAINKFTLALQCLIFFFIGAPLGAIIRKGGIGVSLIISVLVFIFYFILDNSGYRMARQGSWAIWFGKGLAPAITAPIAVFVTYKANNDSMVFNPDGWRNFFRKLLGLRLRRSVQGKEVIIEDPHYAEDKEVLVAINHDVTDYSRRHNLKSPPNIVSVFFRYQPDHEIERINEELEAVIKDLSNTRDGQIIHYLNQYPVLAVKAHTRPFERRWLNIAAFLLVPVGAFLYFRMWSFRLRLLHDLRVIRYTDTLIINHTETMMRRRRQPGSA